jgi:ribosomal protein S21
VKAEIGRHQALPFLREGGGEVKPGGGERALGAREQRRECGREGIVQEARERRFRIAAREQRRASRIDLPLDLAARQTGLGGRPVKGAARNAPSSQLSRAPWRAGSVATTRATSAMPQPCISRSASISVASRSRPSMGGGKSFSANTSAPAATRNTRALRPPRSGVMAATGPPTRSRASASAASSAAICSAGVAVIAASPRAASP